MTRILLAIATAAMLSGCVSTGSYGYGPSYMATSFETVNYGLIGYGYPGWRW